MDPNTEIQLYLEGYSDKTKVIIVKKDCTIAGVFKAVSEKLGLTDDFGLVAGTKQMKSSESLRLADYNLKDESRLLVVFRLHGGKLPDEGDSDVALNTDLPTPRWELRALPGFVSITTTEPCMILREDDESPRAKIFCGHVISPDGMLLFFESCRSSNKYQFICPGPSCQQEWPFFVVCHVANITGEDKVDAEKFVAETYARRVMGVQQCPECHSFCMPIDKKAKTVRCVVCYKIRGKKFEFCWSCLHESTGSTTCKNAKCDGKDPRVKFLVDCPKTKMQYSDIETPSLRACPKCHIIIQHNGGCKTMTCTGCNCVFCFVCLKQGSGTSLECGSYKSICKPAPVQMEF